MTTPLFDMIEKLFDHDKIGSYTYKLFVSDSVSPHNGEEDGITLMHAPSHEDGPATYEALSRKRLHELTSRCAEMRKALAKQRSAAARKFAQERRAGDSKGTLLAPASEWCVRVVFPNRLYNQWIVSSVVFC